MQRREQKLGRPGCDWRAALIHGLATLGDSCVLLKRVTCGRWILDSLIFKREVEMSWRGGSMDVLQELIIQLLILIIHPWVEAEHFRLCISVCLMCVSNTDQQSYCLSLVRLLPPALTTNMPLWPSWPSGVTGNVDWLVFCSDFCLSNNYFHSVVLCSFASLIFDLYCNVSTRRLHLRCVPVWTVDNLSGPILKTEATCKIVPSWLWSLSHNFTNHR